jgi:transposase InsO family protein
VALYRAGEADAERVRRKLQRSHARRAAQRDAVLHGRQARSILARWVDDYNTKQPRSSLVYVTPAALAVSPALLRDNNGRSMVPLGERRGSGITPSRTTAWWT